MTSSADFRDRVDDGLGEPRPRAFAYLYLSTGYEHAEAQWRQQISEKAEVEGYAIERWYADPGFRDDGLAAMLAQLRVSDIQAIFVPDPTHLEPIRRFDDIYGGMRDMSATELARALNRQIFVLSERFAEIIPPGAPALAPPAPAPPGQRGFRRWRSWHRRG